MINKVYSIKRDENKLQKFINCYGIDLGTTYTLFATVDSKNVDLSKSNKIPVQFISINQKSPVENDPTISDVKVASILALCDGKPYVGNNLYHLKGLPDYEYKKNIFYHWKIEMGVDQTPMYPDAIIDKLDMPYKIAGGILNYCRMNFLEDRNTELENAIITVPASFQANQREDTMKAAEKARIKISDGMLIDEPNAAFLGYFNRLSEAIKQDWANKVRNKNILIIDFGGGTCDLSILNVDFKLDTGISISNKAISRYNDLGGQDIDMLIAEELLYPLFMKEAALDDNVDLLDLQSIILPQLAVLGEQLKVELCDKLNLKAGDKSVDILDIDLIKVEQTNVSILYNSEEYIIPKVNIHGGELSKIFNKIYSGKHYSFKYQDKTITTISQTITDIIEKSNLTLDEVDYVLYAGGSSFNPFLISRVSEKLPESIPLVNAEPDKLIAEGAAVYSYFYYNYGIRLISPITSDTIGIRIKGNKFHPIIENGNSLPISVELKNFSLQTNILNEIVVPVCVNAVDFAIGEIRCPLQGFYNMEDEIKIVASVSIDKMFDVKLYINDEFIGSGEFDNPFSIGAVSEEELEILKLQSKMNKAKQKQSRQEEKLLLKSLIWKHSDVDNNHGVLKCAEEYIKRFDDQNSSVWNMVYCSNSALGRVKASKKGLEKAMELSPNSPSYIYNYSLLIAKTDGDEEALNYLLEQNENIQNEEGVRCKIVLLKKNCDIECKDEAKELVELYKDKPRSFSDFDKRILLPGVFRIAEEQYAYVKPTKSGNKEDEKKYLDTKK